MFIDEKNNYRSGGTRKGGGVKPACRLILMSLQCVQMYPDVALLYSIKTGHGISPPPPCTEHKMGHGRSTHVFPGVSEFYPLLQ